MSNLNSLRDLVAQKGLDALIVHSELNQRYLTGFEYSDGLLLITQNKAYIITDFRYYEMAVRAELDGFDIVTPADKNAFIDQVLKDEGIAALGFEGDELTYSSYVSFGERHKGILLVNIGDIISKMRQVKDESEVEKTQKAQDIADKAFSHLLSVIKPDMTEIDVVAELEYAMKKNGSEGIAFPTIAVSGDASALPHGTPRNIKLQRGFLTMDFGAKYCGYCSDMTRTIVIGRADEDMKKLYNTVLAAQSSALQYLEQGRDAGEADKCARDIINIDYPGAFGHSLGHGIGLLVHEMPAMSPRAFGKMLIPGNIVSVEPGIYIFGKYGCRIEDMILIKEKGILNFTHSTKELIEVL